MMQDNYTLPAHHGVTGDAVRAKCTLNLTLAQVTQTKAALHLAAVVSILSLIVQHYQSITQKQRD